jgi:hypothetical protein
MDIQKFVNINRIALANVIEEYLATNLGHAEVQRQVDQVFSNWETEKFPASSPMADGEKELWCAIWATQHLATSDHWADGITQKELGLLMKVLKGVEALPASYEGRRP